MVALKDFINNFDMSNPDWKSSQGYKAIASWQTAMLLRDMLVLWFKETGAENSRNFPSVPVNFRLFGRLEAQVLDAARSVIANIEEGYTRPDTKAYLQFLGYSQASLAEVRGDVERMKEDDILKSVKGSTLLFIGIKTPAKDFPYSYLRELKSCDNIL
ncbi:MAG: four helix bundle protein [Patescibacteria group bacterium]|nr:four helix bundle protein [Patescibacteria group bacterium]